MILIVGWFLYRRKPERNRANENTENIANIKNTAYEGDTQAHRRLPQVPYSNSGYEEPAEYQQLDSSRRIPVDANYQSLVPKNKQANTGVAGDYTVLERENEDDQRYTSLRNKPKDDPAEGYVTVVSGNQAAKESIYEELP